MPVRSYEKIKHPMIFPKRTLFALVVILVLMAGCQKNRLRFDPGNKDVIVRIERFDRDLFSIHPDSIPSKMDYLRNTYGKFLDLFGYVINIGESNDPLFPGFLKQFLSDETNREVYVRTQEIFQDLSWLEKDLTAAFRYYKYYFPDKPVPRVYTYVSRFNHSLVVAEDLLAIGLDKFMGADVDYYVRLGLPRYLRDNMYPAKIPSDCMFHWAATEFEFAGKNNVLNRMIYYGKIMYFTSAMLPGTKKHLLIGYSEEQEKWCRENEQAMFGTLVGNKLLFDDNYLTINKLVNEAPFTHFFSRESPGRTGVWIGWQIVRSYMKHHPEMSLAALMLDNDYQKIFEQAHYKP